MKRNLLFPVVAFLLIASCEKDKASPSSGGGGGGTTPTQTGTAHITSWSPAIPYADDTVTFHGTGFNPTASGNIITTCNYTFEVVSASATQVKAHLVQSMYNCLAVNDFSTIVFQANGWSDTLPDFHWKRVPQIMELHYFAPYYCNAFFRGGDSLEIVGIGFGPNSLASWSIGNYPSPGMAVVDTEIVGWGNIRTRLGPSDLGSSNDECDTATVLITLTNTDGRVFSRQTRIGHGPHMIIQNVVPNISSASRAYMIANNLVIYATVNGRFLKTCMTVGLYLGNDLILTTGGPPGGFPNSYVIGPIAPVSLVPGAYEFLPVDCDGILNSFSGGGFTLTP